MTDKIMDVAREIPWYNDLSEYQQMKLKTFCSIYIKEQLIELLTRGAFDDDIVSKDEAMNELTEEVLEHYYDMLQDEI